MRYFRNRFENVVTVEMIENCFFIYYLSLTNFGGRKKNLCNLIIRGQFDKPVTLKTAPL